MHGQLLMGLNDGGLQYLLAGARGTVGLKAGRYAFEAQLVELVHATDHPHGRGKAPQPRSVLRVGLSTAGSSVLLADEASGCYFDVDGHFVQGKRKTKVFHRHVRRGQVMTVVVNLDAGSANANTVSLFVDGKRACQPQALSDELKGKPLFPTVTYRGASVRLNLGTELLKKLPFACRAIGDAAKDDAEAAAPAKRNGPREVLVPVGLPEEGAYDWLDSFLAENPSYEEISERKILRWAERSGLHRQGGFKWRSSNDSPDLQSGLPPLDKMHVNTVLANIAPMVDRNFVLMGLKRNLTAKGRSSSIEGFDDFKKVAVVAVGEPPEKQKEFARKALLEAKTAKAVAKAKKDAENARRKRLVEERRKKQEAMRAAKKAKTESGEKKEEKADEPEKEEEEKKEEEPETEVQVPEVTLDDEEKKVWYRKSEVPDISPDLLASSYSTFTLPGDDEGFDEVRYAWKPAGEAAERLRAWILARKKTQKVESLQPSQWFKDEHAKWQKAVKEWREVFEKVKKAAKEHKEDAAAAGDAPSLDAEDIKDVGEGVPLFAKFAPEDWTLLNLRYELHLLTHAFRKDLDDADRVTIPLEHAAFYYNKYYKKSLTAKQYGMKSLEDVVELVRESVAVDGDMLKGELPEDAPFDKFVRATEEQRRDRERRIDAGDESATLKFSKAESRGAKGSSKGSSKGSAKGTAKDSAKGSSKGSSAKSSGKGSSKSRVGPKFALSSRFARSAKGSGKSKNGHSASGKGAPSRDRETRDRESFRDSRVAHRASSARPALAAPERRWGSGAASWNRRPEPASYGSRLPPRRPAPAARSAPSAPYRSTQGPTRSYASSRPSSGIGAPVKRPYAPSSRDSYSASKAGRYEGSRAASTAPRSRFAAAPLRR
eukprot:TRINITY_DN3482_c0_g2_i1.p1 TRINITY_DN3482_c0_g2~~TRINITY_DN3482_c0_g2_i1.p1  ORF type:complete len:884 (-),score=246.83 TRINITY_DN3482_c0_g2_i1:38-2689(-)